jgi:CubicO group peptidase (beta-lactamase class C family)
MSLVRVSRPLTQQVPIMRLLCLGILVTSALQAQHAPAFTDPDRAAKVRATAPVVERLFRESWERQRMPALAYGVVLDGDLVYSGAFGQSNVASGTAADTKTLFRIASMSKSFTALAILQLRDAGRLDLDDRVADYIPEMARVTPLTTDAPAITIRHLLTHSAGFPEDNPWGDRQLADTDEELRALVAGGISFSNVPGVEYEYSNLGFALLGQIVQVASGMEFRRYMAERVFGPLGMTATVWEYDRAPAARLAHGYDWVDDTWAEIPLEHHGAFGAMGGLITSIEDFSKYVALHLAAWPPRSDPDAGPLRRSSLREMQQPWRFAALTAAARPSGGRDCPAAHAYGYGLRWTRNCDGRVAVGHSGGLPGFGSNWTMMPDYGLAVVSFDNRTYGGTSALNVAVLDTIVALAELEPRRLPASEILERRRSQIVALLPDWEGAERSGVFAENFFLDYRLADLVERSRRLFAEAGPIRRVSEMRPLNQLRGAFVLEGESRSIEVFFTLTPERDPLIQEFRIGIVER